MKATFSPRCASATASAGAAWPEPTMAASTSRMSLMRVLLGVDLDALPEGDAVAHHLGFGLRIGVIPDGVGVHLAVDDERVVARLALPGTGRLMVAERHVLALQRSRGEIVIALHHHGVVALRNHFVFPGCLH